MTASPLVICKPPPSIGFQITGGRTIIVPPANRARLRAALALEADAGGLNHRARLLIALCGPVVRVVEPGAEDSAEAESAGISDGLTPLEQMSMLSAIVGQATGLEPAACVAFNRALPMEHFITSPAPDDSEPL